MIIDTKEEEKIIDKIIEICNNPDKEQVRKDLRWDILGQFIGQSNAYEDIKKYVEKEMKEQWKDASRISWDNGWFGWSSAFVIMMDKILRLE
jgi:hypothetical protein